MTTTPHDDLAIVINTLAPYLDQIVLVGGWAAWVYPRWAKASARYESLLTTDVDLALPPKLNRRNKTLRELLLGAGFDEEFLGNHQPPVSRYHPPEAGEGVFAEFLSDRYGDERHQPPTEEISGVVAQRLRYMQLALHEPLRVEATLLPALSLKADAVLVPHPANYLVHKLLVIPRRSKFENKVKDLAYVYQVLRDTRKRWPELQERLEALEGRFPSKWTARARRVFAEAFDERDASVDVAAMLQTQAVAPSSEEVMRVVARGAAAVGLA